MNKLKSAQVSLGVIHSYETAWNGIPGFVQAVESVEQAVERILECGRVQTARSGNRAAKTTARTAMLTAGFTVCSGLKALASATSDSQLATEANYSRSSLARGREAEVVSRCQTLFNLGTENAAALAAEFNVSANDLKALKAGLADYSAHLPKPRERQARSAAATKELVTLFTTLDELFGNQLDPLLEKFKESNAGFYNEHRTARLLVDSGAARAGKPATDAAKSDTTANKSTKDGGTTKAA